MRRSAALPCSNLHARIVPCHPPTRCPAAGITCGFIGQGIANSLMLWKRAHYGASDKDVAVPPLGRTALVWGMFMVGVRLCRAARRARLCVPHVAVGCVLQGTRLRRRGRFAPAGPVLQLALPDCVWAGAYRGRG